MINTRMVAIMSTQVNIYETKTNLSKLINRVIEGEEIIIAKSGNPVARLVPIKKKILKREAGLFKDQITYDRDIDKPLPDDIISEFYK